VSRIIKLFQEIIESNPPELKRRFLYVTFDIIKEQVGEVKKFGACASRMRSRQRTGGSRQEAAGRRQQAGGRKININGEQIYIISLLVN